MTSSLKLTFQVVKEDGEILAFEAWLQHDKDRVASARLCPYSTKEAEERDENGTKRQKHGCVSGPWSPSRAESGFLMVVMTEAFETLPGRLADTWRPMARTGSDRE